MSILVDNNTRLLVQGITGSSGAFHASGCMEYGTKVVAGVTPGKGGQIFEGQVPIFDTVYEARRQTDCNATMIFVPGAFAADAILEAADAGVELIGLLYPAAKERLRERSKHCEKPVLPLRTRRLAS